MAMRQDADSIRSMWPVGTRVVLHHMDDEFAPPAGTEGTVTHVDGIGQIHVKWDNGSALALIPGVDSFGRAKRESGYFYPM